MDERIYSISKRMTQTKTKGGGPYNKRKCKKSFFCLQAGRLASGRYHLCFAIELSLMYTVQYNKTCTYFCLLANTYKQTVCECLLVYTCKGFTIELMLTKALAKH